MVHDIVAIVAVCLATGSIVAHFMWISTVRTLLDDNRRLLALLERRTEGDKTEG